MSAEDRYPSSLTRSKGWKVMSAAEALPKATFGNGQAGGSKAPSTTLRTRCETVVLAFVHPIQANALKSWLIRFGSAATAHHGGGTNSPHRQVWKLSLVLYRNNRGSWSILYTDYITLFAQELFAFHACSARSPQKHSVPQPTLNLPSYVRPRVDGL